METSTKHISSNNSSFSHKATSQTMARFMPLLYLAFAATLLTTILFVLESAGLTHSFGISKQKVYTVAHLSNAFGLGVLMWFVVKIYNMLSKQRHYILYGGILATVGYHLAAAAVYAHPVYQTLFVITMALWGMRLLLSIAFFLEAYTMHNDELSVVGLIMFFAFATSATFGLTGIWYVLLMIASKFLAILLAVLLLRVCILARNNQM